jgi:hypothetical protein
VSGRISAQDRTTLDPWPRERAIPILTKFLRGSEGADRCQFLVARSTTAESGPSGDAWVRLLVATSGRLGGGRCEASREEAADGCRGAVFRGAVHGVGTVAAGPLASSARRDTGDPQRLAGCPQSAWLTPCAPTVTCAAETATRRWVARPGPWRAGDRPTRRSQAVEAEPGAAPEHCRT